ncbi:protein phosphatase 2c 37 [Phtheirospermum japonicum]|uniref:protein-serine/threonine phosphatase n=1 Tax=Phtheirospermum japonicum TaxID=374723 RepID=A0A830B0R1_9LAMI|nr:protein phosphatase 2c 37 [Phtheirospermum japonicum]
MINNSTMKDSPAEMDVASRRRRKLIKLRQRRMELWRLLNSLSESAVGGPLIPLDPDVPRKRMRSMIETGEKTADDSFGTIAFIGRREEMEDALAAHLGFAEVGGKSYDFYGVFDGHGGRRVAQECSKSMHKVLARALLGGGGAGWAEVMDAAFKEMDEEVNAKGGAEVEAMGTTAVVALVGENEIVVANCGDSRAVLCRGKEPAKQLSIDHKPETPEELARIKKGGGMVIEWHGARVCGVLSTSRSLGDKYLKPHVIPDPGVQVMERQKEDEFLILASDGLWDVVPNELACQVTRSCLDGQLKRGELFKKMGGDESTQVGKTDGNLCYEAAAVLVELAIGRGSYDNVSVVVVDISF